MKTLKFFLTGIISLFILLHFSCTKENGGGSPPPVYTNGEGEIGSAGGSVLISDQNSPIFGTSLTIPEGALSNDKTIKIIPAPEGMTFPLDTNSQPVLFEPEGLTFSRPVEITLPFNGADMQNANIYYYDETDQLISGLPLISKDITNKTVTGQTDHFSFFIASQQYFVAEIDLVYCNEENKIGAMFHVIGWNENSSQRDDISPGLSKIPVMEDIAPIYGVTAEEVCKSDVQMVHAILELDLCKDGDCNNPEGSRKIRIIREKQEESYFVKIMNENGNILVYETDAIPYEGDNGMEGWYKGMPLVFYFNDYNADLNAEYSVKARWQLATGAEEGPLVPLTYNFEIDNNTDTKKPVEMEDIAKDDIYENTVLIDYVEEDYGQPCPGVPTVVYEGTTYHTVQIGDQCWMKENLNYGTMINNHLDMEDNYVVEKYCYANDPEKCDQYGALYQWNEMMRYFDILGGQGLCPDGWHVPTDYDWSRLEGYADSEYGYGNAEWFKIGFRGTDAGYHLKAMINWNDDGHGDDKYGFYALPGGTRASYLGDFADLGLVGYFWSSSINSDITSNAWIRVFTTIDDKVGRMDASKTNGFSVRCIKDE